MTALVDFLPASFRQRRELARSRRVRLLLGLIVCAAVVVTDLAFQRRIATIQTTANLAQQRADAAAHRAFQREVERRRVTNLRREIAQLTGPLERPSMAAILDDLLVDLPSTVRFHELQCSIEHWAPHREPRLRLDASSSDLAEFAAYLRTIGESPVVPPLHFKRTELRQHDGTQGFRLENSGGSDT